MMTGKTKCDLLREIRRKVCELNGLDYSEQDCPHAEGCRKGTCPACEAQLERINALLKDKRLSGGSVHYEGLTEIYNDMITSI